MPSHCSLYIEAICTADTTDDRVGWWKNVYGFDLSTVTDLFVHEAQVQLAEKDDVVSNRHKFHSLATKQAQDEDLDFESKFNLVSLLFSFLICCVYCCVYC